MSLNANKPEDQVEVSQLPAYIRESRVAINAVTSGAGFGVTNLAVPPATTSLTVGTDLLAVGHEIVIVTGGVAVLETILGGTEGQIKTFILFNSSCIQFLSCLDDKIRFCLTKIMRLRFAQIFYYKSGNEIGA